MRKSKSRITWREAAIDGVWRVIDGWEGKHWTLDVGRTQTNHWTLGKFSTNQIYYIIYNCRLDLGDVLYIFCFFDVFLFFKLDQPDVMGYMLDLYFSNWKWDVVSVWSVLIGTDRCSFWCVWNWDVFGMNMSIFGDGIFMLVWDETNYIKVDSVEGEWRDVFLDEMDWKQWHAMEGWVGGWMDQWSLLLAVAPPSTPSLKSVVSNVNSLASVWCLTTWRRYQTYTRRAWIAKFS